jgi:hypothetical protein
MHESLLVVALVIFGLADGCNPLKNVASGKPRFPRNALKRSG